MIQCQNFLASLAYIWLPESLKVIYAPFPCTPPQTFPYKRSSIENKYRSNEHIALNASRQEFIAFTQRKRKKLSQQAYNMIAVFVNNLQQKSTYLLLRISVSCNQSNNIILIVRFRTLFCICGQGQK